MSELYTSDTSYPQFIKATVVHQDQAYDDKIYYFFREDNPDKNPEAPLNVSRVAQLCRGDQGGESSLSVSKWNTFLKAMLVCSDAATNKNFNRLQDVFLLPDPSGQWRDTRVYGVFSNPWNYSAVCVYSLGDIDRVFRTSSLKGYHGNLPSPRPGKCLPNQQPIPTETFQVADSHPEVAQRVEPIGPLKTPLFHSKYHYQKVVVHRMQASHGETFHVLYLTTDKGTIHKVVESGEGAHSLVFNIMEIQPFRRAAAIQTLSLDPDRRKLYVTSQWEVSQVPLDLCEAYGGGCHGCLMSRDPYCGWDQGRCVSIYSSQR
uniref:Sema domain-containing protein n=1 Tax=Oryctolagus cuniculus TaxID=9986 RepID=A0A5F9CZ55_RABIT